MTYDCERCDLVFAELSEYDIHLIRHALQDIARKYTYVYPSKGPQ